MRKLGLIFGMAVLFFTACQTSLPEANYDVIPQPKEVTVNEEKPFEWGPKTVVHYEAGLQREAQFLSEYVNDLLGFGLEIVEGDAPSGMVLSLAPDGFDHAEAYEIKVTSNLVMVDRKSVV